MSSATPVLPISSSGSVAGWLLRLSVIPSVNSAYFATHYQTLDFHCAGCECLLWDRSWVCVGPQRLMWAVVRFYGSYRCACKQCSLHLDGAQCNRPSGVSTHRRVLTASKHMDATTTRRRAGPHSELAPWSTAFLEHLLAPHLTSQTIPL